MSILIPEAYLNQHRVLERIYNSPSVQKFPNIAELSAELNLTEDEVIQASYLLVGRGFASVSRESRPFIVRCTPEGSNALMQRILLDEGKEKAKANILRWTQIAGIITASIISLSTFVMNTISTITNARKIEVLQAEINSIKSQDKVARKP
jgi:hypothetical protein